MVIKITLHEELDSTPKNRLRVSIQEGIWRAKWRKAKAENDDRQLDILDRQWDMVHLP